MAKITDIRHRMINAGNVDSAININVYEFGTSNRVTLYSDEALTSPVGNPYAVAAGNPVPILHHSHFGELRVEVTAASGTLFNDDPYDAPASKIDLASTGYNRGAGMVATKRSGSDTATRTQAEKNSDIASIYDWDGSGLDDTVRFERAFAGIGSNTLLVPAGSYAINGIIDVAFDGMTLKLAAGAELNCDVGLVGVDFSQANFGSAIRIRNAHNFSLVGEGPSSMIRMVNGTQGNGVSFLHSMNPYVRDIMIQSDYTTVTAQPDDTFCTGLMVIAYQPNRSEFCNAVAEGLWVRGFLHYGAQAYGDRSSLKLIRPNIRNIGDPSQTNSVGGGVAFTRATQNCGVFGGTIRDTKWCGIFAASAGLPARNLRIEGNDIFDCGQDGILVSEEAQWGTAPGNAGTMEVTIAQNNVRNVHRHGIMVGTFNGDQPVGPLADFKIVGNIVKDAASHGILCMSTNVDGKRLENGWIDGNTVTGCTMNGIGIVANCRNVKLGMNDVRDNAGGQVVDDQNHWTPVTFTNGFENAFGLPFPQCAYRKDGKWVTLRGALKTGSAGNSAFTLPAGYRPKSSSALLPNLDGYIDNATGNCETTTSSTVWNIDGIRFEVE